MEAFTSINRAMLGSPFEALHSRPVPSKSTCRAAFQHDRTAEILSALIVVGLIISYVPQHYRIIHNKSSQGFAPFFLLLGATSSASSLLNIVTLQWAQIECCQFLTAGQCFESVLGIAQVFFQWLCFNIIFVLFLIFYPRSAKYVRSIPADASSLPKKVTSYLPSFLRSSTQSSSKRRPNRISRRSGSDSSASSGDSNSDFDPSTILLPGQVRHTTLSLSPEYRFSLSLFALTVLHFVLCLLTTLILVVNLPTAPPEESTPGIPPSPGREHASERAVRVWATVLGVASVALGCCQYMPQLWLTARTKLVGSLSIPMMILQVPGSFLFVYTLAVRPGVNWTGYGAYFVTGCLQGALLILCISWKFRQSRLGVDDWGNPLVEREGTDAERLPNERTRLVR